jgi:AcrR family transcriptional regulator
MPLFDKQREFDGPYRLGTFGGNMRVAHMTMDARQRRTRQRLTDAILTLASENDLGTITVSELTVAAGINRSTFYQHANSPVELLESVLRERLDRIRDGYIRHATAETIHDTINAIMLAVVEHVEENASLYRRTLGEGSAGASLHVMLAAYFQDLITDMIDNEFLEVPRSGTTPDVIASFLASGTVGALDAWLERPEPRDPLAFLRSLRLLYPAWWPLPLGLDEFGHEVEPLLPQAS